MIAQIFHRMTNSSRILEQLEKTDANMPLRRGFATVKNRNVKKNTANVSTQVWDAILSANVMVAVINKIKIVITIIIITDILLLGSSFDTNLFDTLFIHIILYHIGRFG